MLVAPGLPLPHPAEEAGFKGGWVDAPDWSAAAAARPSPWAARYLGSTNNNRTRHQRQGIVSWSIDRPGSQSQFIEMVVAVEPVDTHKTKGLIKNNFPQRPTDRRAPLTARRSAISRANESLRVVMAAGHTKHRRATARTSLPPRSDLVICRQLFIIDSSIDHPSDPRRCPQVRLMDRVRHR